MLIQCFERRCLTYTPGNPDGWQVEAGNVGQHYFHWRYGDWLGQIAFAAVSSSAGSSDIYTMRGDGSEIRILADNPANRGLPGLVS